MDAYAIADVAVLLSRRETWGVVINEAMAAGLPIIATERVGATADLVEEGENGFVVESGDAEGAASSLAYLAENLDVRARFGSRSRELIQRWDYNAGVQELVGVLEGLARPS